MSKNNLPKITIYTDGACNPNPGPGGWAAILLRPGDKPQELAGAEEKTSNNRMELRAVLEALKALVEPHQVTLYTDSNYLRQGITEWLPQWQQRGWRTSAKTAVKNQELWQALAAEVARHRIDWHWVKGHAGNQWNERADELARSMLPSAELPLDDPNAIHIFIAASCRGAYGPGGWAASLRYGDQTKAISGHEPQTSANQMHIMSAIQGLQAVKKKLPIHIYTTSDYLKDGITRWVKGWQSRNWQTKAGKPVSHRALWEALLATTAGHQINWHLVSNQNLPDELSQAKKLAAEAVRGNVVTSES
jgi:ribonuclease HI